MTCSQEHKKCSVTYITVKRCRYNQDILHFRIITLVENQRRQSAAAAKCAEQTKSRDSAYLAATNHLRSGAIFHLGASVSFHPHRQGAPFIAVASNDCSHFS